MVEEFEGSIKPSSIEKAEHVDVNGVGLKRVLMAGYDGTNIWDATVTEDGSLSVSDESNALLRRILKVLESNNVTDNKQRQKVVIEGIGANNAPASTEINTYIPMWPYTQGYFAIPAALGSTMPITEGPVDQRWRVAEDSHISYQASIRSHLAFT